MGLSSVCMSADACSRTQGHCMSVKLAITSYFPDRAVAFHSCPFWHAKAPSGGEEGYAALRNTPWYRVSIIAVPPVPLALP